MAQVLHNFSRLRNNPTWYLRQSRLYDCHAALRSCPSSSKYERGTILLKSHVLIRRAWQVPSKAPWIMLYRGPLMFFGSTSLSCSCRSSWHVPGIGPCIAYMAVADNMFDTASNWKPCFLWPEILSLSARRKAASALSISTSSEGLGRSRTLEH